MDFRSKEVEEATEKQVFFESLITNIREEDAQIVHVKFNSPLMRYQDKVSGIKKVSEAPDVDITSSHLPSIDSHVRKLARPGRIKQVSVRGNFVVYYIVGNHYCRKKRGYHKTNNIMYKFCLESNALYQDCWSENCNIKPFADISLEYVKFKY